MRIYLAATEDVYRKREEKRVVLRVEHLLVSYNGKGGVERYARAVTAAGPPRAYCVDSGAHFFISAYGKHGARKPIAEAEAHQAGFLDMIRQLEVPPAFVVELDLQDLYGMDVVTAWRRDIWMPFQRESGIPVCFVRHVTDGPRAWWDMLDHPDMHYIGFSGAMRMGGTGTGAGVGTGWRDAARMVHDAYLVGKPVHGFAQVRVAGMRVVPFYSVDSTSWGAGALFGTVHTFDLKHGRMRSNGVGSAAFKTNPARAAGTLLRTKARVSAKDMAGGSSQATGLSAIYQEAANAYKAQQDWHTGWWKNKGVDWEGKLNEAGGFYARFPPTFR